MKKNKTKSKLWIKWSLFIIGIIILTFGARLLLLSKLGVGGLDAIAIGLSAWTGMSIGTLIIILGILLIITGGMVKKRLSIFPIGVSLAIGWLYDLWGRVLFNKLNLVINQPLSGYIFLLGILIAPFGAALYILSELSVGPVDYLMFAIQDRMGVSIQSSRTFIESAFVLLGWLVRGPIGVGTICIMLFWGPILQVYYKLLDPKVKRYMKE